MLPIDFDPTPSNGQVVFLDGTGTERIIDFLVQPFGLDASDILRTSLPVEVLDSEGEPTGARFRVMHPERCMESRIHNVVGLPGYDTPRSLAQLRASVVCTREFLIDLLAAGRVRPLPDLAERIFRLCHDHPRGRAIYEHHGIDPFSAVFTDSSLPGAFNDIRYPQMVTQLAARRARCAAP